MTSFMHLERNFFGNAIDLPSSIVITIILKQIKESEAVKSFLLTLPPPPPQKKRSQKIEKSSIRIG